MEKHVRNLLTALIAIAFAFTFTGCGSKQERAVKQQINLMNEFADEFEKNPKSDKLAKIEEKILAMEERMKTFDKASEDEAKKLLKEYGPEMGEAAKRYLKAKMSSALGGLGTMLDGVDLDGLKK